MSNILVYNTGENPMPQFNFLMRVELLYDIPCYKINAINRKLEYEYIQEGGLNDYVHMRRKQFSQPFTFTVSMHTGTMLNDPLQNGTELLLPILIYTSRLPFASPAALIPERIIVFTGCTVVSRTYGELNAESSGILSDDIEIAYREFAIIDVASGAWSNLGIDMPKSNLPAPSPPAEPPEKTEEELIAEDIKNTENELAACEREIAADEVKLSALEDKIEENDEKITALESDVTDLTEKRDAITDTKSDEYKAADEALTEKQHELADAKREDERLEALKDETEEALLEAKKEKAELTAKLSALDERDDYLKENEVEDGLTAVEYTELLGETKKDIAQLNTDINGLEREAESNNALKEKLKAENELIAQKNTLLDDDIYSAPNDEERERLKNEKAKNEAKIASNNAVIDTLDKLNNDVSDAVKEKKEQLADKKERAEALEKKEEEAKIAEIDEELAEQNKERNELVDTATALQQDIAKSEKELAENEAKKKEFEDTGSRGDEYIELSEEIDDQKAQLESDKSELQNTEQQIAQLDSDISENEAKKEQVKTGKDKTEEKPENEPEGGNEDDKSDEQI